MLDTISCRKRGSPDDEELHRILENQLLFRDIEKLQGLRDLAETGGISDGAKDDDIPRDMIKANPECHRSVAWHLS